MIYQNAVHNFTYKHYVKKENTFLAKLEVAPGISLFRWKERGVRLDGRRIQRRDREK
jgi:hypothetical protein